MDERRGRKIAEKCGRERTKTEPAMRRSKSREYQISEKRNYG